MNLSSVCGVGVLNCLAQYIINVLYILKNRCTFFHVCLQRIQKYPHVNQSGHSNYSSHYGSKVIPFLNALPRLALR